MTTAVYRLPSTKRQDPSHSLLVCHLRSISSQEAITKLQASGVLAIPGPEANSIVLVGYHLEIRRLLSYYRTQELGLEDRYVNRTMGKLRKRLDSEVHSHAIVTSEAFSVHQNGGYPNETDKLFTPVSSAQHK